MTIVINGLIDSFLFYSIYESTINRILEEKIIVLNENAQKPMEIHK